MKIEVSSVLVGKRVSNDFGDRPWEHYLFQCTVKTASGSYDFEFRSGIACAETNRDKYGNYRPFSKKVDGEKYSLLGDFGTTRVRHPSQSDILYSLASDADAGRMSHFDFCDNFGYDRDSIKGLETYILCQKTLEKLRSIGINQAAINRLLETEGKDSSHE